MLSGTEQASNSITEDRNRGRLSSSCNFRSSQNAGFALVFMSIECVSRKDWGVRRDTQKLTFSGSSQCATANPKSSIPIQQRLPHEPRNEDRTTVVSWLYESGELYPYEVFFDQTRKRHHRSFLSIVKSGFLHPAGGTLCCYTLSILGDLRHKLLDYGFYCLFFWFIASRDNI